MSGAPEPRASHRRIVLAAAVALLCAAPTPGDIGGCGQKAELLDPPIFHASKDRMDCIRCEECAIDTQRCELACDPTTPSMTEFPEGCFPLVHDGEVCLRALLHASCSDYEAYVSDSAPEVPTECNFCP